MPCPAYRRCERPKNPSERQRHEKLLGGTGLHTVVPVGNRRITPHLSPGSRSPTQYSQTSVFWPPTISVLTLVNGPARGVVHQGAGMVLVIAVATFLTGHSTSTSTTGGIGGRVPGIVVVGTVGVGTCAHAVLPTVSTAMPMAAIDRIFMNLPLPLGFSKIVKWLHHSGAPCRSRRVRKDHRNGFAVRRFARPPDSFTQSPSGPEHGGVVMTAPLIHTDPRHGACQQTLQMI